MATYTGDATIVDIINASASRNGSVGTTVAYTCPTGMFAEVQLISASVTTSGSGGKSASAAIGSFGIVSLTTSSFGDSVSAGFTDYPGPMWINEGQSVQASISDSFGGSPSVSISVIIKEYNKP